MDLNAEGLFLAQAIQELGVPLVVYQNTLCFTACQQPGNMNRAHQLETL